MNQAIKGMAKTSTSPRRKAAFVPRVRLPGEAPPSSIDRMCGFYKPSRDNPAGIVRHRSLDFMDLPSRGYPT